MENKTYIIKVGEGYVGFKKQVDAMNFLDKITSQEAFALGNCRWEKAYPYKEEPCFEITIFTKKIHNSKEEADTYKSSKEDDKKS